MTENQQNQPQTAPPHAQLVQMAMSHWVSHIVYVAAKLGLADHLAKEPMSVDRLTGLTGTHAPSLYRLMRTLASLGIVTEDATRRFSLTALGDELRTGAPGSARASILTIVSDWWVRGFGQLLYSVQTGKSGFEKVHPEEASLFSETMAGFHGAEPPAVAAAYDFSGLKTIAA